MIVDEAHKLPDAAKQMFGKSLCYDDIREICFYLGNEYQGPEIRKLSGTIRMVLDIIGENHRTRYGIKEEFHMTEECAMYLYEGIQTMNKIIEKLEKKIPKWIRNKLEETKSVLECFFHQDKKYVLHLKQDHDHRIILCASSRRIPQYLDQMLWSRGMGAILTSGTLKTGQGFSHIRKMTGLQRVRRVREYVADSPFEYQKNCLLYLPKNLKTCRRESQEEAEMIADHIHSLICSTYGHTLVLFRVYSDDEMKRLNAEITQMDVQIARCLLIHQMLGTRISDTLTLRPDCLTRENGQDMIEIYQVKTKRYKKPISKELAKLLQSSIEYTQEKFGDTEYIFVNEKEPDRPMQYMAIKTKVMSMIQEKQLKDDHGELFGFGTHMFRHYYGVKLTEMHLDDWTIARLLGHKRLNNVQHYRKMSNQRMADETREVRQRMSDIIYMSLARWGEEYEQIRQDD